MYYEQEQTQQEIANALGISRIRVSRMLQQARQDGVVRISISYEGFFPHLERKLGIKYPGVRFLVADSLDGSNDAIKRSVGSTAADYLGRTLGSGSKVAVGWGTTLKEMASRGSEKATGATFIPIIGGQVRSGLDIHANSIASLMAQNMGGSAMYFFAPAVAESVEAKQALVSSQVVKDALDLAVSADVAVFSVGSPFAPSTTIDRVGYYTPEEIELLRESGAACDIISISYFDEDGVRCGSALSDRTVSVSEDQLRAIPLKVCLAGGEDKQLAIRIALGQGLINVLVTDNLTAAYLLGE